MFKISKIYVRSIVAIVSMSAVVCYIAPQDATILGAYMAAVVGCVLLDKGEVVE